MDPVKIGLLGLGTVGGGTVTVLHRNAEEIARRAGRGIIVSHASVRDRARIEALGLRDTRLSSDPSEVVDDPEIAVVVELFGGEERDRQVPSIGQSSNSSSSAAARYRSRSSSVSLAPR